MAMSAIENISDTARWVAVYRALESKRKDALFHDPWAEKLAGQTGRDIAGGIPFGVRMGWTVVVRTKVIDELILKSVREDGVDTIVSLAAGLDTRPYRLDLPPQTRWIEVDLPGIFDYKHALLKDEKPRCALESVKLDLSDSVARKLLLQRIGKESRKVLVLTEGFLMYLKPEHVEAMAAEMASEPSFKFWLQDYVPPTMLKFLNVVWHGWLSKGNSKFQFFHPHGYRRYFADLGWKTKQYCPFIVESRRLGRQMPMSSLVLTLDSVSPFHFARKSAGILLLERPESQDRQDF